MSADVAIEGTTRKNKRSLSLSELEICSCAPIRMDGLRLGSRASIPLGRQN